MRAGSGRFVYTRPTGNEVRRDHGWLQAGSSSFAYRLAHLAAPRGMTILFVAIGFYLA